MIYIFIIIRPDAVDKNEDQETRQSLSICFIMDSFIRYRWIFFFVEEIVFYGLHQDVQDYHVDFLDSVAGFTRRDYLEIANVF